SVRDQPSDDGAYAARRREGYARAEMDRERKRRIIGVSLAVVLIATASTLASLVVQRNLHSGPTCSNRVTLIPTPSDQGEAIGYGQLVPVAAPHLCWARNTSPCLPGSLSPKPTDRGNGCRGTKFPSPPIASAEQWE